MRLTTQSIVSLCGRLAYDKGAALSRAGKVRLLREKAEEGGEYYEAEVAGPERTLTIVRLDQAGDIKAECSCPSLSSYQKYCSHVAALLVTVQQQGSSGAERGQTGSRVAGGSASRYAPERGSAAEGEAPDGGAAPADEGTALAADVLALFASKPARSAASRGLYDAREPLDVEFLCRAVPWGYRDYRLGVELKLGPKRLFIVQNIHSFLDCVERGEPFSFTRHFTYDPSLHRFKPEDDAVLRQLIGIGRSVRLAGESGQSSAPAALRPGGTRLFVVPPFSWEALQPLLAQASAAVLEQDGRLYGGVCYTDERLPLAFAFEQTAKGGDALRAEGLDDIVVLEAYGAALAEGGLRRLEQEPCRRLGELKRLLTSSDTDRIPIAPEQIAPFMDQVMPGLLKLGSVHIAREVSERLLHRPLKAKLYLDRVRDRLLAALEFHYGDLVVHPLEAKGGLPGEGRILMRDGERENRLLELMAQGGFTQTEGGFFLEGEEAEFEFLYRIVPQIEQLADVYATSAVKARLHTGHTPPRASAELDERTDWLEIHFDLGGIPESEIRLVLKSLEEKRSYYRLPGGALAPLEGEAFEELLRLMNTVGIRSDDVSGNVLRLPAFRSMALLDVDQSGSQAVRLGKTLRGMLAHLRNPEDLDFPVPPGLRTVLRDYQVYGYQWLKTLALYRFGGVLADDMGLGKTVQSIAFLVSVLPDIRARREPALVVAPASLMYNWRNELRTFAPEVRVRIVDGTREERARALRAADEADVLVTSYPLLRRDAALYAASAFHTLVLDEAQAFKNDATQTARAVKALRAGHRFALTGTPLENGLAELRSIYDAVFPGLFPGRKAFGELSRETVARRIRPFLLRRLKQDVLQELPGKIETLHVSELLPAQKRLYAAYLAKLQQDTLKHLDEGSSETNRIRLLAGLTRLRQLCCHPALFLEEYEGSAAKFEQLLELIDECRGAGKRLLVFSQFTRMLGLIGRELGQRGVPFFYLDGETAAAGRVGLCDRFNRGERDVFLISLKAGGTGLNLTGADTVVLYDLWWNPAVEQQAADRAHRIGQKRVVQVIRLIAQGTIEEKMVALQQRKLELIRQVVQPDDEAFGAFTEAELRELLSLPAAPT